MPPPAGGRGGGHASSERSGETAATAQRLRPQPRRRPSPSTKGCNVPAPPSRARKAPSVPHPSRYTHRRQLGRAPASPSAAAGVAVVKRRRHHARRGGEEFDGDPTEGGIRATDTPPANKPTLARRPAPRPPAKRPQRSANGVSVGERCMGAAQRPGSAERSGCAASADSGDADGAVSDHVDARRADTPTRRHPPRRTRHKDPKKKWCATPVSCPYATLWRWPTVRAASSIMA